jgi:hypothetical protein
MAKGDAIVVFRPMVDSGDDGGVPGSEIDNELDRNRSMLSPARAGGWCLRSGRWPRCRAGGAVASMRSKNFAENSNLKCNLLAKIATASIPGK